MALYYLLFFFLRYVTPANTLEPITARSATMRNAISVSAVFGEEVVPVVFVLSVVVAAGVVEEEAASGALTVAVVPTPSPIIVAV